MHLAEKEIAERLRFEWKKCSGVIVEIGRRAPVSL
jgi:hypothetical protein